MCVVEFLFVRVRVCMLCGLGGYGGWVCVCVYVCERENGSVVNVCV